MKSPRNRKRPAPRTPRGVRRAGAPVETPVEEKPAKKAAPKPERKKKADPADE